MSGMTYSRRRGLVAVVLAVVALWSLSGCWTADLSINGEPAARVTVSAAGEKSKYSVSMSNDTSKKAKLKLVVNSVYVGEDGRVSNHRTERAVAKQSVKPGKTISVRVSPLKNECLEVVYSIGFGKAAAHEDSEIFKEACCQPVP